MTTERVNPLSADSDLPLGVPPFDQIEVSDWMPAFEQAFAEHLREIQAITRVRSMPTFENTMVAWERSGSMLRRVSNAFYTISSADATAQIQDLDERLAPLMAAHIDRVMLDPFLYQRVDGLVRLGDALGLTGEDSYLLARRHREMRLAGAALDEAARAELTALNERLSVVTTQIEKNMLAERNARAVHFTDESDLAGLSDDDREAMRVEAAARGLDGWVLTLLNYSGHPALAAMTDRDARRRVLMASLSRGLSDDANDNRPLVLEAVRLRARRARLLGYPSHAALVTADETAGSPEAVGAMLTRLAAPAVRNARAEAARLTTMLEADGELAPLEASDWAFYTERLRAAEYEVDTAALRAWFEADRVLHDGVFRAATALYGVTFTERFDVPTYHPEVRAFDVADDDGTPVGMFLLDLYTRATKHGGAWMNPIVEQAELAAGLPVVMNNLNVRRPASGPTLLTLDEVETLFHEFGHALHGLFARTRYPRFSGTNVHRDFVEYPSQVNEMWAMWPSILDAYARHHETGEPLPDGVVDRLQRSAEFNQGFETTEYLAAAWLDFAWHSLSVEEADAVTDVAAFERDALAQIGLDVATVPPRYSTTYFSHIWAGGYSAGYYAYIWSEVLDADTVDWFRENGGLDRRAGDRFRSLILGIGGSRDPLDAYREFRGRDADIVPLLQRRGLTD